VLFDRLSVFVGGFTLELGEATCAGEGIYAAEVSTLLSSLVDKSLVVADPTGERTRYRLLESVREYSRDKLTDAGEQDRIARRHAEAFLELAERFRRSARREFVDRDRLRDRIVERGNWSGALAWSLEAGHDVALGQRLAAVVAQPSYVGSDPMAERWLSLALQAIDGKTPPALVADLEFTWALYMGRVFRLEERLAALQRAAAIRRELGDRRGLALAHVQTSQTLSMLGRVAEAEEVVQLAIAEFRALRDHEALRTTVPAALQLLLIRGDLAGARTLYAEAMRSMDEGGRRYPLELAGLKSAMAWVEAELGDLESALNYRYETVSILREVGHPNLSAELSDMACDLIALDRHDEARERSLESLELALNMRSENLALYAMHRLAAVAALRHSGDAHEISRAWKRAARLLGYIDARIDAIGQPSFRYPVDQRERDRTVSSLREALAADELAYLLSDGAALSAERAIDLAKSI
jgi:predicted transcriptional regulator